MPATRSTHSLSTEAARAARQWYIADASDQVLGRLATRVASTLRGKHRPTFAPHIDAGDFVIIINAAAVRLSGKKDADKRYHRHTGYPGGVRTLTATEMRAKHPTRIVRAAVEGMLPKTRLGRQLATKLKIYAGAEHPHQAQKPLPLPPA
jgi:large subunit ribosomal protein L13